jgi:hypothetical protein
MNRGPWYCQVDACEIKPVENFGATEFARLCVCLGEALYGVSCDF